MQHTQCGVEQPQEELEAATGADLDFLSISDHTKALRDDIDKLVNTSYLKPVNTFAGLLFDVDTGRVDLLQSEVR
jgi:hypothetical protein